MQRTARKLVPVVFALAIAFAVSPAFAIGRRCSSGQCGNNSNSQTSVQVKQALTEALEFQPATTQVSVSAAGLPASQVQTAMLEQRAEDRRRLDVLDVRIAKLADALEAQMQANAESARSLARIADALNRQPKASLDDVERTPEKLAQAVAQRFELRYEPSAN